MTDVIKGAVPPAKIKRGPESRWKVLGLELMDVWDDAHPRIEDQLNLAYPRPEAKRAINSIRCHANRITKQTGKKFSVFLTDIGIGIRRKL